MEVLLDSSFIVSSVMKRIDFLDELAGMGFRPVVPREVLQEMKDLKLKRTTSHGERAAIDIAFEMIEKGKVRKTKIGGMTVDDGLISRGSDGIFIATLDRGIKMKVPNKVVIDSAKGRLRIVRD